MSQHLSVSRCSSYTLAKSQNRPLPMIEPFMQSKNLKCPKCGKQGMIAKLKEQDSYHLIGDDFRLEISGEGQEIVCVICKVPAEPET
jgi:hypothetical protein